MTASLLDSTALITDPALAFVAPALDPHWITPQLQQALGRPVTLQSLRVMRHKPGRRCLIAYEVAFADGFPPMTLLGKVRSRGLDTPSYGLQTQLWQQGFDDASPDGISVPEPLGTIPEVQMWLQRYIPGTLATQALAQPQSVSLCPKIAAAIAKLHRAGVPTRKRHTPADELRILEARIPLVLQHFPDWEPRLEALQQRCIALAQWLPAATPTGIHRDFYADQVLVSGAANRDRLYLLDLDLYCEGDPALDMGNFVAHLTEQSLRTHGHLHGFAAQEAALSEAFCRFTGASAIAVQIYKLLTLVRHLSISAQMPERRGITPILLHLCEASLAAAIGGDWGRSGESRGD
ncbi:MAG: aminoglycoside phosphotransferase family protein [Thermosynechococcaceae cyanobacterium MS004]|nr:aminoglycoside phosphotransferase family protein [Thermosynechococcaceae cyanobacterium MS004]